MLTGLSLGAAWCSDSRSDDSCFAPDVGSRRHGMTGAACNAALHVEARSKEAAGSREGIFSERRQSDRVCVLEHALTLNQWRRSLRSPRSVVNTRFI